jgi:hypothetical protein
MDNCFCLLIPKPDDMFTENSANNNDESQNQEDEVDLREHGIQNRLTTIAIEIDKNMGLGEIQETEDNEFILENLKDFNALLNKKYLPMIKKWVTISSKAG